MPLIEMGKEYRTRGGNEARVYNVDGGGNMPVHGAIKTRFNDEEWAIASWSSCGHFCFDHEESSNDLIEVKPLDVKGWVNVYADGKIIRFSDLHATKEIANDLALLVRFACISITFREGDGLEDGAK